MESAGAVNKGTAPSRGALWARLSIRFPTKGDTLYAFAMGRNLRETQIKALIVG